MTSKAIVLQETALQLAQDFSFSLEEGTSFEETERALQWLQEALARRLAQFLRGPHHKLSQLLYRIDISEERVDALFSVTPFEEIPARLAGLIIERQLEKIQTRMELSQKFAPPKE